MTIPINPIFAWCIFLGFMALWACLHLAACDIEITRKGKMPKPEKPRDFSPMPVREITVDMALAILANKKGVSS